MGAHECRYEIRVAEELDSRWSYWFTDIEIIAGEGPSWRGTIMRGRLPDQAALYGLLGRIRDLNLTLLEVRRLDEVT